MDIQEKKIDNYENDLKRDKSKTKKATSSKTHNVKIKENREREEKLCERYGNGLKKT